MMIKDPRLAFPRCPSCCGPIMPFGPDDVECGICGWNSLRCFVDAGGIDAQIKRATFMAGEHPERFWNWSHAVVA